MMRIAVIFVLFAVAVTNAAEKPVVEEKAASYGAPKPAAYVAPKDNSYGPATHAPKYAAPTHKPSGYAKPAPQKQTGYGVDSGHQGYYYYYYPVTQVPTGYGGGKKPNALAGIGDLITTLIPIAIVGLLLIVGLPILLGLLGITGIGKRDLSYSPYMAYDKFNELTNIVEASFEHEECVMRFACETGDLFKQTQFSDMMI